MTSHEKILEFCKLVRESFPQAEYVYKNGSCYKFHDILKFVFPSAEPFNHIGHVLSDINGKFYDVSGEVKIKKQDGYYLKNEPLIWIKYKNCIYDMDEHYKPIFDEPTENITHMKNRLHGKIKV